MDMALSRNETDPDIDLLRSFHPLQNLTDTQLSRLAEVMERFEAPPGRLLLRRGSRDNYSLFLVKGRLRLRSADGKLIEIAAGDPSSYDPIARLLPRMYDVASLTPVTMIRIDNTLLEAVHAEGGTSDGYSVSGDEGSTGHNPFENQIAALMLEDLEQNRLKLPSLPDVAVRIGKALRDETSDADRIARLIQTDPVITAKLIKAANSALYGRRTPVESCSGAVVRLGTQVTHELVISYALKELFKSESALLQQRMQALWEHSTRVAAISYVLARHDARFNPEHAMLAGLLHDIGVVAVLNYAESFPMEARQPAVIDQAVQRLRAQTGSMLLQSWGFASHFVITALE